MKDSIQVNRAVLGISLLLGMCVNGFTVISLEVDIPEFALKDGVSLRKASFGLILRSIGSVLGAFVAGTILDQLQPHSVIYTCIIVSAIVLGYAPHSDSYVELYVIFSVAGILICIIQTGVFLLIRRSFTGKTGSWLQGAQFCFQSTICLFPLISALMSLHEVYHAMSAFALLCGIFGFCNLWNLFRQDARRVREETAGTGLRFAAGDFLAMCGMFFLSGSMGQTLTYLGPYVDDVQLNVNADLILFGVTSCILISNLMMVHFQLKATTDQAMMYFQVFAVFSSLSQLLLLAFPRSVVVAWIGFLCFGFCWGPLIGLFLDLWDRYTFIPTSYGSAVVNVGMYAGTGILAAVMFDLWDFFDNPKVLLYTNMLALVLAGGIGYSFNCVKPEKRKTLLSEDIGQIKLQGEDDPLLE